jgi:hypothetical protein
LWYLGNSFTSDGQAKTADVSLQIQNSIISSDVTAKQFVNVQTGAQKIDITIQSSIVPTYLAGYDATNFKLTRAQLDSVFNASLFAQQIFSLDTLKPINLAKDRGTVTDVTTDITRFPRDTKPDLGAYERRK